MKNLHEAFMESAVMQGLLAVMLVGSTCYMYITGQEVPDALIGLSGLAIGFYFRTKGEAEGRKSVS